jgi:two-component system, probable response regulator PhcQ
MNKILLVDDDPNMLRALERALRQLLAPAELKIEAYADPQTALDRVCLCDFDLVISDYRMPQMNGSAMLQALQAVAPDTVRIMLSASTDFSTAMSAINEAHVFRFLSKPWQPEELAAAVRAALQQRAALLAERAGQPPPSPRELEEQRLEREDPGILHVKRAPDGSIIL